MSHVADATLDGDMPAFPDLYGKVGQPAKTFGQSLLVTNNDTQKHNATMSYRFHYVTFG
ncbi:hypothetical protein JJ691_05180 [Kutzneria sp. CA-103260]|nr:hypothetical protein JJ691_05180 [Kutzneria sp. CA-103260]